MSEKLIANAHEDEGTAIAAPREPLVSFIVTTYNQVHHVRELLDSLPWGSKFFWEAVVVDDASTDLTAQEIGEYIERRGTEQVKLVTLRENTGGPSVPRNTALEIAQGKFVFFLDGDDVLLPHNFDAIAENLDAEELGILRLPMEIQVDNAEPRVVDRVNASGSKKYHVALSEFVAAQSMGVMAFLPRTLIEEYQIRFSSSIRVGEDLVFMSAVAKYAGSIEYCDLPLYRYIKKTAAGESATVNLDSHYVSQVLKAWKIVQENYLSRGVDFLQLHGVGTVSYIFGQVAKYFVSLDDATIAEFIDFVQLWKKSLDFGKFLLPMRTALEAAAQGRHEKVRQAIKPYLLVAGSDLKFIRGAFNELEEYFNIITDEWASERVHDEKQSQELLKIAHFVWVEWLTDAAVWYSQNVRDYQKLVVRGHFYELTRDAGWKVKKDRISGVVAIALHTYEDFVEKFQFSRERTFLIPNFYDVHAYRMKDDQWNPYAVALIGAVPRRKGLHRALKILKELRAVDQRYTLTVFGKGYKDFGWVNGVPEERYYYEACDRYVQEHDLSDAVHYEGWADIRKELKNFGYVLSVSDFEGSHVAPGEAFCAGVPVAMKRWRGAEYVYPDGVLFHTDEEIVRAILTAAERNYDTKVLDDGRNLLEQAQDVNRFAARVQELFAQIPQAGALKTSS